MKVPLDCIALCSLIIVLWYAIFMSCRWDGSPDAASMSCISMAVRLSTTC